MKKYQPSKINVKINPPDIYLKLLIPEVINKKTSELC